MEMIINKSVKIPFSEFAKFINVDPERIKGGYVSQYGNYIEVYLND